MYLSIKKALLLSWLKYLTIIPRTHVGYELLDCERGAEHRFGYYKLISNKRERNNCFINPIPPGGGGGGGWAESARADFNFRELP